MIKVKIKMYDGVKYDMESEKIAECYYYIENFKVLENEEAERLEETIDEDSIDEFHEYLVLDLGDGDTATFKNSHTDLFIEYLANL